MWRGFIEGVINGLEFSTSGGGVKGGRGCGNVAVRSRVGPLTWAVVTRSAGGRRRADKWCCAREKIIMVG